MQWQRTGDYVNFPFSSPFPPFVSRISTDAVDRIVVFTNSSGDGSWTLTAVDAPTGGCGLGGGANTRLTYLTIA